MALWRSKGQLEHRCPKGRKAVGGVLSARYLLTESEGYRQRTRRNVHDSDATLITNLGELDGGTLLTRVFAEKAGKPCLIDALDAGNTDEVILTVRCWLERHRPETLNVAGPREQKRPGIYTLTYQLLDRLAAEISRS